MKKIFTLLVLAAGFALSAEAQYYYVPFTTAGENPGNLNNDDEYPVGGGLSATWTSILGGSNPLGTYSAAQTLPFAFSFNGTPVTQFKVSNTGILTFDLGGAQVTSTTAASLPNAAIPDQSVVVWGLSGAGSNDEIVKKTFGTAPNRQQWVFFSSYTKGAGWTYWSIVLEETTNNIYIVDQRHSGPASGFTLGVQINSTTAVQVAGSPNVSTVADADPTALDNGYYKFINGVQPALDMSGQTITMNQYNLLPNAPFAVTGTLRNDGASTVTSFTLNYSVNGGATVSGNITGVSIPTYGTYNFTHPTNWNPTTAGTYTIDVWATNINGSADQNTSNDMVSATVEVFNNFVARNSFMEVFTSSTCGPCKPGNDNTTAIFGTNPTAGAYANKWTMVKYQQDFPGTGDPYCTDEALSRRSFYAINSIPRMEIDGGWDGNASAMTGSLFNSYQSIPSFLDIDVDLKWNGDKTYTVSTTINPVENISTTGLKFYIALVEKETDNNVKSNGETVFHLVMKKMLPNASGTNIGPFTANTPVTVNQTYTFNGNYRLPTNGSTANRINHTTEHSVEEFSDMAVVVWVQHPTSKEVFQSAYSVISNVNVNESAVSRFNIFPNPADDELTVAFTTESTNPASVQVLNMLGQVVINSNMSAVAAGENQQRLDVSALPAGMYLVRLNVDGQSVTKKINVQ